MLALQSVTEAASPLVFQHVSCWFPAAAPGSYLGERLRSPHPSTFKVKGCPLSSNSLTSSLVIGTKKRSTWLLGAVWV